MRFYWGGGDGGSGSSVSKVGIGVRRDPPEDVGSMFLCHNKKWQTSSSRG